jgi:septal ring factor EnvC (AmiA/AmiB activator)
MKMTYIYMIGLFLTTLFVGPMAPVFAQQQPPSGGHQQPPSAADIVAKMQSKLNLTQDQVTAVTPIIEKYSSQREELWQSVKDASKDKESIRSQMKQLKSDENQELSQFLSADQMSQWEQMQNHRQHKQDSDG